MHLLRTVVAIVYQARVWCHALPRALPERAHLIPAPFDTGGNCCPRNSSCLATDHIASQSGSFYHWRAASVTGVEASITGGQTAGTGAVLPKNSAPHRANAQATGAGVGVLSHRRAVWIWETTEAPSGLLVIIWFLSLGDSRNMVGLVHHYHHAPWHTSKYMTGTW